MGSLPEFHTNPYIFLHMNGVDLSDEFEILFLDSLLRKQQSTKLCAVRSVGS